jgi:hypothetical protein
MKKKKAKKKEARTQHSSDASTDHVLDQLFAVIVARKGEDPESSGTPAERFPLRPTSCLNRWINGRWRPSIRES